MIEIKTKIAGGGNVPAAEQLALPFELRQKRWLRTQLVSGEEVSLRLPRGALLCGGDLLAASDGRVIEVIAVPENVVHVECATPDELARVAYHLGNRHVPVEIGAGFLRLQENRVLEDMVRGLGAQLTRIEAPFEPEVGAYGGGQSEQGSAIAGGAKIHEYSSVARANDPEGSRK
jgi:urease accessory protein